MSGISKNEQDLFAETETTLSQWQKLGIEVGVKPAERTADIEGLLVDSAEFFVSDNKLTVPVASWLCRCYRIVCKHRLARIIKDISCPEKLGVLKSLLSFAKREASTEHFNLAINACGDFENVVLHIDRVDYASIKEPAVVMEDNPDLHYRAIFSGGLKASVIVSLIHSTEFGISESALAKNCGVTRKALRDALEHLEFCQLVCRESTTAKTKVTLNFIPESWETIPQEYMDNMEFVINW
ncbi:MAG: hypothetical protein ACIAQZ_11905 [Sedimentisphaeraceae bacterium JB056]